ncbi:hypothetical protein V2J09_007898 [Rumex salicifolius]
MPDNPPSDNERRPNLRPFDIENDDENSPRGVLEGCKNGIGSDPSSPRFQESRSLLPIRGKPFYHWRKLVDHWKKKSLKHLNTFPLITRRWNSSKREQSNEPNERGDDDLQSSIESNLCYFKASWKIFPFSQLKIATNGFSEDGQLIAVKRLIRGSSSELSSTFLSELEVFVHVDHHNIAKLIGYGTQRGIHLVFQLSSLGSLGSLLTGSRGFLNWTTRYKIALGIAEGLVYLHDHCEKRLIHRDIKSDNILLAENFQPQICDFGLAVWLPRQKTNHSPTTVKHEGTFGYIAPEYIMQGVVDEKTDVFAFGIVLLELITGRPALDESNQSILIWAKPLMQTKQLDSLIDPCIRNNYNKEELGRMAVILLKGDECEEEIGKQPPLKRTFSKELLDVREYNSTKYLKELRRHRQVAFSSNMSDLTALSPRSPC